jgi:DNA-binding PadR family transcriptional regulator
MDFNDCACSGKTLGRLLQPAVMGILAEQPLHGYLIVQRLTRLAMFKANPPDPTGLYRLLRGMEDEKLVTATWDLADSGPAKRRFELTRSGRQCLTQWVETLKEYRRCIDDLLAAIKLAGRKPARRKCCEGACHA